MRNNSCPVCGKTNGIDTVSRDNLITMQNYVYREYDLAINAETGQFNLRSCRNCGFSYNSDFDSNLLSYDENYDNNVPSVIFENYYKEIASFLYDKFSLSGGFVIDVGCGKGTFLRILCALYPDVKGLGIDPSYEPNAYDESLANLDFIQDIFREEHITEKPSLIISRHVLEHIEKPVRFLQSIRSASSAFKDTLFFIEVPDLEWIIENEAFWDFCYEHCNYFNAESLGNALQIAGFKPEKIQNAFGGQYLWALGKIGESEMRISEDDFTGDKLSAYSAKEKKLMSDTKTKLQELKSGGTLLAIWGMATKGTIFSNLTDPKKELFDYCIDINPNKVGGFVPHTGHRIDSPDILREAASSEIAIVVMNPNYTDEIKKTCQKLELDSIFIDANGNNL